MRPKFVIGGTAATLVCVTAILMGNSDHKQSAVETTHEPRAELVRLAEAAISPDAALADPAIERLRAAGPAGLHALMELCNQRLSPAGSDPTRVFDQDRGASTRLEAAIDRVSGQRYGSISGLYWYTNFNQAVEVARSQHKPILSLRLLGELTDDFSCANSRFFRTTLYANQEVGDFLRDSFVLHWQSVRPVPKVTIDFGDGRRLRTTLTGNSIHYVLSPDGQPVDALPGLYGPQAFLRHLRMSAEAAQRYGELADSQRPAALTEYHRRRMAAMANAWAADLERLGHQVARQATVETAALRLAAPQRVPAIQAARIAMPKSVIETRMIAALTQEDDAPTKIPTVSADWLSAHTSENVWRQIAALHEDDARLDMASVQLIQTLQPLTMVNDPQLLEPAIASCSGFMPVSTDVSGLVGGFEKLLALDTVRNEYQFRRQVHGWFANSEVDGLDALNERVYNELFLTPRSDPWLGLLSEDVFTALPNSGLEVDDSQ